MEHHQDDLLLGHELCIPLKLRLGCYVCRAVLLHSPETQSVQCPSCGALCLPDPSRKEQELEEAYFRILESFTPALAHKQSALRFLLTTSPSKRSSKISIPSKFRFPVSKSGGGGYADIFKALGLVLRASDIRSGHWHYWYLGKTIHFPQLQRAIHRRIRDIDFQNRIAVSSSPVSRHRYVSFLSWKLMISLSSTSSSVTCSPAIEDVKMPVYVPARRISSPPLTAWVPPLMFSPTPLRLSTNTMSSRAFLPGSSGASIVWIPVRKTDRGS